MTNILLVFDIDGTLTDTVLDHQKAFAESLIALGVNEIKDDFNTFVHHTDSYISKTIFENSTGQIFGKKEKEEFTNILTSKVLKLNINEIRGAVSLIEELNQKENLTIVFATGALRATAEYKLKSLNISFEDWQLVASDHLFERAQIVTKAIENAQSKRSIIKFDRIISLGDGIWDLKTAQKLGIEFIGIGDKHRDTLIENGAKKVFSDLTYIEI